MWAVCVHVGSVSTCGQCAYMWGSVRACGSPESFVCEAIITSLQPPASHRMLQQSHSCDTERERQYMTNTCSFTALYTNTQRLQR